MMYEEFKKEYCNIWFQYISDRSEIYWDYSMLSKNPNITWEMLSQNPNITWEIVQKNPDKPWNYSLLSQNPNITWEVVL